MSLQRKEPDAPLFAGGWSQPEPARAVTTRRPMAETSLEAWRTKTNTAEQKRLILSALAESERTLDEVAARMDVPPNRISGRFGAMKDLCWIERTGGRRKTRTGSSADVWRITPLGRSVVNGRSEAS